MLFNPPRPDPGKKKKEKIDFIFYLHTSCVALKGLVKALKAFIKPFEAPQGSVKIKLSVNFYFNATFWNARGEKG